MTRAAGVTFRGTKDGKANPTRIPSEGFEDHYLVAAGSKRKSAMLVVDTDGYLRRASVAQAWQYRNNTDADVADDIRNLGRYFDDNPLPGDAYEDIEMTLEIEEELAFDASTPDPDRDLDFSAQEFVDRVGEGFNEFGVRTNTDEDGNIESVDVLYEAMEPGPPERRNGVRITDSFLENVVSKEYDAPRPPHLKDHQTKDSFARIGEVREAWFSENTQSMWLMTRTPNVDGSRNHEEAVARYTHEPPEIRNGSLGFGDQYEAKRNSDGEPELVDGKFREFSTVNFPGGYDEGGVKAAFAEAVGEAMDEFEFDDAADGSESAENSATESPEDAEFEGAQTETITF